MRAVRRPVRPIAEALQSVTFIARQPAVPCLAMDTLVPSHLGHRSPTSN